MDTTPLFAWFGFHVFIFFMLAIDLGVFHRKAHEVQFKEACVWSFVWIALALLFNVGIFHFKGHEHGLEFLTAYLVEKSLSVDNLFIFLTIFNYFRVPKKHQHKVLFWGVLGALIMRAIFILAGVSILNRFHWVTYVFGGFLVLTGFKLLGDHKHEIHEEKNIAIKILRKFMRVSSEYHDGQFTILEHGKRIATPLLVVLLIVETTDLIFAVDSIPAVLAISKDPFVVYTSNIFAIMGLRALFFALQGMMGAFHLLNYGLAGILMFIGVKMLVSGFYHFSTAWALGVIGFLLGLSMILSWLIPERKPTS